MPMVVPYLVSYAGVTYGGWSAGFAAFATVVTTAVVSAVGKDQALQRARQASQNDDACPVPDLVAQP